MRDTHAMRFKSHLALGLAALLVACLMACMPLSSAYANDNAGSSLSAQGVKGDNVTGKANRILILDTASESGHTWNNYDVTGDTYADKFRLAYHGNGDQSTLKIYINGKLRKTCRFGDWYACEIVTLKNGTPFLFVSGGSTSCFYQYINGKLKVVCSSSSLLAKKQGVAKRVLGDFILKNNSLTIKHNLKTYAAGWMQVKFTYTYKKGTMVRTNSTTAAVKYYNASGSAFGKPSVKSAKTFTAYRTTSLKKAYFKVKKGSKVKITACNSRNGVLYLKVYNGKKSGWIKAFSAKKAGKWGSKPVLRGSYENALV